MAAQRATCQLRGRWRKKTLTPNYRPHVHRAHPDIPCQLHHGFCFFNLAATDSWTLCRSEQQHRCYIIHFFMCWAVFLSLFQALKAREKKRLESLLRKWGLPARPTALQSNVSPWALCWVTPDAVTSKETRNGKECFGFLSSLYKLKSTNCFMWI